MRALFAEPPPLSTRRSAPPSARQLARPRPAKAPALGALAIIAHDLRGPLANLALLIDVMESHGLAKQSDRIQATADKAQKIIGALTGVLNGFLQRARDTGDPLSFRPAPVTVSQVLAEAALVNRPLAESRGVRIDCACAGDLTIDGDKTLLAEALGNLIGNAVKFSPTGGQVRCAARLSGREALIEVADAGPGLSEADLGQAFRPFAALSTKPDGLGPSVGLGLWIVRLIAEQHGGSVAVAGRGALGGACFAIRLPLRPEDIARI